MSFESVDNVHGGDGLSLGVLGVIDSVTNDVLQEDLVEQSWVSILIEPSRNSLRVRTRFQVQVRPYFKTRGCIQGRLRGRVLVAGCVRKCKCALSSVTLRTPRVSS